MRNPVHNLSSSLLIAQPFGALASLQTWQTLPWQFLPLGPEFDERPLLPRSVG